MKATPEKQSAPKNNHLQQDFFKNSAKETFFSPSTIQPKLTIGQPNDQYEQEADAVADRVVNGKASTSTNLGSPQIQTMCAECAEEQGVQKKAAEEKPKEEALAISKKEEEEKPEISKMAAEEEPKEEGPAISKKEEKEEEPALQTKPLLMRKTQNGASVGTSTLATQLNNSRGSGQTLPRRTNQEMSQSFGTDFSQVHIHTDSQAAEMNQGLSARAFTHGSDIYFNRGEYNPGSTEGKRLLAHELTHVVQQGRDKKNSKSLQRAVRASGVSCNNPTPALAVIVGNDPTGTLTIANTRALELLDNAIDEISSARNAIISGSPAAWPTISDVTAQSLSARFGVNPETNIFWTSSSNVVNGRGTALLLIRRLRSVRSLLAGSSLRYTCISSTCDADDWAFTFAGDIRIRLCQPFWDSHNSNEQALTLLHEVFHVYFGGTDSAVSMWNAHCIEQFVSDINDMPINPEFEGSCG